MERFGRIDYLLNFAGNNRDYPKISPMRPSPEAIEMLERIVDTDLLGTARMVFHVEPIMRKQKNRVIITIGSTPVIDRWENDLLFQIAKVGNKQMTEVIAEQHRADGAPGVRIYWVAPGNIRNPSTFEGMNPEQLKAADADGWLDSRLHVATLISSLLTGKLKRESGASIRIDSSTAPQLFAESGDLYIPLTRDT
jgi:NAD(P)-dependent dehydrogenase (short-subunit alcohol dehydrogenase family)